MDVINPVSKKVDQVLGVTAKYLVARSATYDTGKKLIFTPKDNDVTVIVAPGGAEAIAVAGSEITITFKDDGVTSTLLSLQGLIAGDPAAAALVSLTGDTGTIPLGYAGATLNLWNEHPIPPVLMNIIDADGNVVPFSGKSISISVEVKTTDENAYDVPGDVDFPAAGAGRAYDLNTANNQLLIASGTIKSFSVVYMDATIAGCYVQFNSNAAAKLPLYPGMSLDKLDYTKVYLTTPGGDAGKYLCLFIGKRV